MSAWIARNAKPIAFVVLAAVLVIGVFELFDAAAGSAPASTETAETELQGLASLAGLIKVLTFLGVGALIARPFRRRFGSGSP